jgi:hypothetical protein
MPSADFTIADVLEWARTKPAGDPYSYIDNNNCALCQFLRETGRCARPAVAGHYWRDTDSGDIFEQRPFPDGRMGMEYALMAGTFGGLVARLEALCPATPITPSNWACLDAYLTDIELASA